MAPPSRTSVEPYDQARMMRVFTGALVAWTVVTSAISLLLPGSPHDWWHLLVIVLPMGLLPALWGWAYVNIRRLRATMLSLDLSAIIAVEGMRIAGIAMLALWSVHQMAPLFAAWTGCLDVFIGLTAVPLAYWAATRRPLPKRLLQAWSTLGLLDFVVALPIAFSSLHGTPRESVATMFAFPMSFIPMVGVPFMVIMHVTALLQSMSPTPPPASRLVHVSPADG